MAWLVDVSIKKSSKQKHNRKREAAIFSGKVAIVTKSVKS